MTFCVIIRWGVNKRSESFGSGGAPGGVADPAAARSVHREPHYLLVDEADSILIDDARTPLILSAPQDGEAQQQQMQLYRWSANHASQFNEETEYWYDRERRKADLTPAGTALVRQIVKPAELNGVGLPEIYDFVERAIEVGRNFKNERDYIVRDGEIVIVDESTGRIAEGRRWSPRHSSSDRSQRGSRSYARYSDTSQNYGANFRRSFSPLSRDDRNRLFFTARVQKNLQYAGGCNSSQSSITTNRNGPPLCCYRSPKI